MLARRPGLRTLSSGEIADIPEGMLAGGFPGQREAFLEVLRQKEKRAQRRTLLAAGGALFLGATGGLAGGVALRRQVRAAAEERHLPKVASADAGLARMSELPFEALRSVAFDYLATLRQQSDRLSPAAWSGFLRLCHACVDHGLRDPQLIAALHWIAEGMDLPDAARVAAQRLPERDR